jgi:hypothetical protein
MMEEFLSPVVHKGGAEKINKRVWAKAYQCSWCRTVRIGRGKFSFELKDSRREFLKAILDPNARIAGSDLTASWTNRVDMLLAEMFSMALEGVQTCAFALCVGGSLARKEACAYSDIECFFLLADDKQESRAPFCLAAEKCLRILEEAGESARGFTFDPGLTPMKCAFTPRYMIEDYLPVLAEDDRAILDVLHDHRFVMGKKELYDEWCRLAADYQARNLSSSREEALQEWRTWMINQYSPKNPGPAQRPKLSDVVINIKNNYYRWLQKIPKFLCQYYGLANMQNTRSEVQALRTNARISEEIKLLFLNCLDKVTELRMKGHLVTGDHDLGDNFLATKRAAIQEGEELKPMMVLSDQEQQLVRGLIHRINTLVTMAQDFLEWAQDRRHSIVKGKSPFLTRSTRAYTRMYPGSEAVLLPENPT